MEAGGCLLGGLGGGRDGRRSASTRSEETERKARGRIPEEILKSLNPNSNFQFIDP